MSNPSQLYLLADHIKLSLLERQRAISLNLEPNSQDGHISRSLDSMREGVEGLEQSGDDEDQARRLREQFDDLTSQFQGFPGNTTTSTVVQPNDPALSSDFEHAKDTRPRIPSSSSFMKKSNGDSPNMSKSVRFRDSPPDPEEEANRAALFPYRDEPEDPPDQSELDNQQVHAYHKQVLRDQDDQLDRLGESIGRQRDLSIQIGDELDDHVQMLDDSERIMDRHQSQLDGARKQVGNIARRARDNKQITIIAILVIILILLIIILKN